MLTVAGFQVPVIPLFEVNGKTGAAAPEQMVIAVKDGMVLEPTVTVIVAIVAHCPIVGVKVYVPVAVLLTIAGFQEPVIPSFEVPGNNGAVAPVQMAWAIVKVGVTVGVTVTVRLVGEAHCPAVGAKE